MSMKVVETKTGKKKILRSLPLMVKALVSLSKAADSNYQVKKEVRKLLQGWGSNIQLITNAKQRCVARQRRVGGSMLII